MGRFNTYQSDLKYTPQTFEKMAALPMALRKQHDETEDTLDLININASNVRVNSGFKDAADSKKLELDSAAKNLAEKISKEGVADNSMLQQLRVIKRNYNQAVSATGVLGLGKKEFSDREEYEKAYTQDATVRAKQGAEAISKNFSDEMNARDEMIKKGYASDPNFQPGTIEHKYAAERYEVKDFALEMSRIAGESAGGTTTDQLMAALVPDGTGGVRIDTSGKTWQNNKKQLKELSALANSELFNKSSKLNQHLRYNGQDPQEFVGDIAKFMRMMTKNTYVTSNKINISGGGGGPNLTDGQYKDGFELKEGAERGQKAVVTVNGINEGSPVDVDFFNVKTIRNRMAELERTGDPSVNTQAFAAQKQLVIDVAEESDKWEMANIEKLDSASKIAGYKNFSDMKNANEKEGNKMKKAMDDYLLNRYGDIMYKKGIEDIYKKEKKLRFDEIDQTMTKKMEKAVEFVNDSESLFSQKYLRFALNDPSSEFAISMGAKLQASRKFIGEQLGSNSLAYQNIDGEQVKLTAKELDAENATSIELQSFATKNMKGVPSISLLLTFGTGDKKITKNVDLELGNTDKSVAREVVQRALSQTSDPKTMYQLNAILDSASANQVVVDSQEEWKAGDKGISLTQSNMIKSFNNRAANGRNQGVINKKGIYGLISSGSHYELKVKQNGESDYHTYNIDDFISDQTRGKSGTELQDAKNSRVNELIILMGYDDLLGVKSFNNDNNPILPEDSGMKRNAMAAALKKYKELIPDSEKEKITREQRTLAVNAFIKETGLIGLKSMNKAAFLKN